ncbi:MAG: dihydroxyacetone kinase subunit DhaK [Culicoidibacterales bacterium]
MKKIINKPEDILTEMVSGFVKVHQDIVMKSADSFTICRKTKGANKVALISGGGSGHEPAHAGFVGVGMLSAAVCGQVFTAPTPDQILDAIIKQDQGAGVLLIIKNYSGDIMNFDMAKDLAEIEDIEVGIVIVDDDIAVENSTYTQGRRGVAGTVFVHKILGAAAEAGLSLQQLVELGKRVNAQLKTIGVALTGATVPEVGKPGFILDEDMLEFGVGIHGEPGYKKEKMCTSAEIVLEMVSRLKKEFNWNKEEKFAILVNGLGATPLMEQYVFADDVYKALAVENVEILFSKVGNYMTALDMSGLSLTLLRIEDTQWLKYLEATAQTVAWKS